MTTVDGDCWLSTPRKGDRKRGQSQNVKGTEAAAATALVMNGKSIVLDEPPVFRAVRET